MYDQNMLMQLQWLAPLILQNPEAAATMAAMRGTAPTLPNMIMTPEAKAAAAASQPPFPAPQAQQAPAPATPPAAVPPPTQASQPATQPTIWDKLGQLGGAVEMPQTPAPQIPNPGSPGLPPQGVQGTSSVEQLLSLLLLSPQKAAAMPATLGSMLRGV